MIFALLYVANVQRDERQIADQIRRRELRKGGPVMCGFGIATIFQVAIFVIVVLVVLALLRALLGDLASITRRTGTSSRSSSAAWLRS